jgi:hypothetical protein
MQTTSQQSAAAWAQTEFGAAELGNSLRVKRLIDIATRIAEKPSGKITQVFDNQAEREGAYRFVESIHVDHRAIANSIFKATACRSAKEEIVYIPVDASSITLTDKIGAKKHGRMSNVSMSTKGAQVMSAIALSKSGVSLGLAGQCWWYRGDKRVKKSCKKRSIWQKESRYWLDAIRLVDQAFNDTGCTTQRWYQCDAGADFRELLRQAATSQQWYTIRACQDRITADGNSQLWATVAATDLAGTYELTIPPGRKRAARKALLDVRYKQVTLKPQNTNKGSREPFTLWAVLALENGTTPKDEKPIEWMLLTNRPVTSFDDALEVIYGYSLRWRVEDFHKTWKSVCKIEESQLEQSSFLVWATILASVAMRAERLKRLAREEPDTPAAEHFSAVELEAIVILRQPRDYNQNRPISLGQAVRWVADLGGYVGNKRSGPPGSITIGRGLYRLEPAAIALSRVSLKKKLDQC